ncbi:hypothetical protein L3Q82_009200 [Scortum barcoo]|uniref:Uncharacterized protein n=1 Tax=Scortum barcoo TaxID=214431 RepID=A0ACB8WFP1_9TELE|nr:hypothetical protein L3Q82_009200 [Scortum barcoo]
MEPSLSRVLDSATVTRESSFVPTTEPARLISLSSLDVFLFGYAAPPAYHSVKEDTGNHRLGEEKRASTVPWGAPVLLTTVSGRDVLQPDVLWSASEVIGDPVLQLGVHSHPAQFVPKQSGLDGIEGTEGTGEVQEKNPHCAASLIQMGVGSMEQVEDGILHTNTWLVGELQAILGVLHLGSEEAEEEPLQRLHQM